MRMHSPDMETGMRRVPWGQGSDLQWASHGQSQKQESPRWSSMKKAASNVATGDTLSGGGHTIEKWVVRDRRQNPGTEDPGLRWDLEHKSWVGKIQKAELRAKGRGDMGKWEMKKVPQQLSLASLSAQGANLWLGRQERCAHSFKKCLL